jgi:2-isopropylmalate synthase
VDPGLDLSDLDRVCAVAEGCTRIPVHPRHPYAGELVYTAFSGSHQDAIRKGFAAQDPSGAWRVPYLPVDPADVGRDYRAVIRVNSQSGKGGVAHVLERDHGLQLPRGMQIELAHGVQALTERHGRELTADEIHRLLMAEFAEPGGPWTYAGHHLDEDTGASPEVTLRVELREGGVPVTVTGRGHGPIEAFVAGLDRVRVLDYHEHAIGAGADAEAAAYVALGFPGGETVWGMGRDGNIVTASLRAMVSALNRHALADGQRPPRAAAG